MATSGPKKRTLGPLLVAAVLVTVSFAVLGGGTAGAEVDSTSSAVQPRLSANKIMNARIPSVCGFQPGRLVNGVLPGTAPGNLSLNDALITFGNFRGDSADEAVVPVFCNGGGIGWPNALLFFSSSGSVVAVRDLGDLYVEGIATVFGISIRKGAIHVRVSGIGQEGDAMCCGTADARLVYRWKPGGLQLASKQLITEKQALNRVLGHVNAGHYDKAMRLADPSVVGTLKTFRKPSAPYGIYDCYPVDAFDFDGADRKCMTSGSTYAFYAYMDNVGFASWRVIGMQILD